MAVIGIFIPGSSVVFVGGVLVGLQVLDPALTAAAAVVGATLGDGISFWLGRHHHDAIQSLGIVKRHADLFDRGKAHFAKHGAASVFFGRFLGPLRAIVPVVAGMSEMAPTRFFIVNVLSALAWAAAHLVPGVAFGASLQLAGAVSSRLVVLLLLLAGAGWLVWRSVRLAHGRLWPLVVRSRDGLVAWARSGPGPAQRTVLALFDPQRPESAALLMSAIVLVSSAWLFFGVLEDVLNQDPLVQIDRAVFTALQGLRTDWADDIMVVVTEIGSAAVAVPVIIAVAVLLAVMRRWRTLAYWVAAVGFAQALVWVLKSCVGRMRPNPIYQGIEQFSFPSGHATSAIVLYGFLAFLLGRGQAPVIRIGIRAAFAILIAGIAFSRLYLGAHWFSDVLAGLSVGLAWVALLGIAHAHHVRDDRLSARALAVVSLGTLVVAAGLHIGARNQADVARYQVRPAAAAEVLPQWLTTGWRALPAARTDFGGEAEEPLTLQWAATPERIRAVLDASGWRAPPPWAPGSALLWLLPDPPLAKLPVLPKFHRAQRQSFVFEKIIDARQRLVVRLWPSGQSVDLDGTAAPALLWLGTVTTERLAHPAGAFTMTRSAADNGPALRALGQDLVEQGVDAQRRDRRGRPVLLAR